MLMRFVDWAFRARHNGRVVVAQWHDLWRTDIAASLVEMTVGIATRIIPIVFLVVLAGDELPRGINPWRRCLGAAVLVGSMRRLVV